LEKRIGSWVPVPMHNDRHTDTGTLCAKTGLEADSEQQELGLITFRWFIPCPRALY
jgi:hypothetical protein